MLLTDEQRKWFLEMEYTPSKDVVKTVEMVAKDSEYYIHLFDKAAVRCKKIGSNFERILLWVKRHQTAEHATEKLFTKGRVNGCGKFPHCLTLRNCHSHPNLQQPLLCSVSSLQHQRKALLYQQKYYSSLEAQMMVSIL